MIYIKLYYVQIKQALMSISIFRANFLLMLLQGTINSILGILCIKYIYIHVDAIAGWTEVELLALWCTYTIVCQLCRGFINPNHWKFIQSISTGNFDRYILKPISVYFQINTGQIDIASILATILPTITLFIVLNSGGYRIQLINVILYLVLIVLGVMTVSSFMILLYSTVFKFIKVNSLSNIFYVLMNVAERPLEIFEGRYWLILLIFFIPAVPVANVPVKFLLGSGDYVLGLLTLASCLLLFLVSRLAIRVGLKKYESGGG